MQFRHVLLTRFNVRLPEHRQTGADWLDHRLPLFERFCLPSVKSQTCRNFDWLLFFDSATPQSYRERIAALNAPGLFRTVYVDGDFTQGTVQRALQPMMEGYDLLISTRVDNDDAICRNFVEVLQGSLGPRTYEFLNFSNGYVWHRNGVYRSCQFSNAFVTLVEPRGQIRTAFCGNHMKISTLGPVRQIAEPAAWLQVVHDRNLANCIHGTPCPIEEIRGFEIAPDKQLP